MAFELTEEQKLQVAKFLTESDATASFVASNEQLFKDTITTSFLQGQPRAGKGKFPDPTRTLEEQIDDPVSARGEFFGNVKRASTNVQSLSESELFVTAYLASEYYGADIDFDELNDPAYSETLQGIFQQTFSNIEAGMSPSASMQEFNIARLDAAERDAAIHEAQEPIREVQAMMKSLGIEVSGVNGEMTESDLTNLFKEIGSSDVGLSTTPAGQNFITFLQNQRNEVFGETSADFNPEEAMKYLRHIADGQDFSEIIEKTVALGDEATEEQISMVQAITGSEVTGKWELETIDAIKAYLENPRGDGFPDSFYSAVSQTNPDLPPGMVSKNALIDGFRDGSIPLLTDEQMDSMYHGLSGQPLEVKIDSIATWAAKDPSNRAELGAMINANTQTADTATMTSLDNIRKNIESKIAAAEATQEDVSHFDAVATASTLSGIQGFGMTYDDIASDRANAEAAETAARLAENGMIDEANAVMLARIDTRIAEIEAAQIKEIETHPYEYGSWSNFDGLSPEEITVQLRDPEVRKEIETAFASANIRTRLYDKFDPLERARTEQVALRETIVANSTPEKSAPEETVPEETTSPEPTTDTPNNALYLSSLKDRGLMGESVILAREEVSMEDSMAELKAYLDGISPEDRIALDNAEAEKLAASGTPITGTEPVVSLTDGTLPFSESADPSKVVVAENTTPVNAPRPMALEH